MFRQHDAGALARADGAPLFACERVTKHYDGKPVIADISLTLESGGFTSIIGPSGAGKTTLFNTLAALDTPDAGRIFLRGLDITGIPGKVAYMPQKDLLLEHLTVLDNTALPCILRGEKKRDARARARSLLNLFGLDEYADKYPAVLSGGMRQRAALLRTCLQETPVILLDEPFSALDAISRERMRRWYEEIAQTMRLSTLCVTHDIEEALQLSDKIHLLLGKPGTLSSHFKIDTPRPRGKDFLLSAEYTHVKRTLLETLGDPATKTPVKVF